MKDRFIIRFIIIEKGIIECIRASFILIMLSAFSDYRSCSAGNCHVCFLNLSENMPGKLSSHVAKFT